MEANATLDCIGLNCPIPIYYAANKIKGLEPRQVLEVLVDDERVKENMPVWCKDTRNELLDIDKEAGEYKVYIKKAVQE